MKSLFSCLIALALTTPMVANATSAGKWKGEFSSIHCSVDLSVGTNGAVGALKVCDLPAKFIASDIIVEVVTPLVGGGSLVVGEDGAGDADGYFTDLDAVTGVLKGSGALVASGKAHKVDAAKNGLQLTIATAAYTAGVLKFHIIGTQGE